MDTVRQARGILVGLFLVLPLFISGIHAYVGSQEQPQPAVMPGIPAPAPLPAPAAVPTVPAVAERPSVHRVELGESLSGIAQNYNIDVDTIVGANPGVNEMIQPGDELIILPQRGILYTVRPGDSLWQIARNSGVEIQAILTANHKQEPGIQAGEKLFLPGAKPQPYSAAPSRRGVSRFLWPVRGEISSPFGARWGRMHAGIDIAEDFGATVRAAAGGRVIYCGWYGGYGNAVLLDHGGGYVTLYGHLDDFAVGRGQYVQAGERIAYVGSTGDSTGPHLHFEIRVQGEPVNPLAYLP